MVLLDWDVNDLKRILKILISIIYWVIISFVDFILKLFKVKFNNRCVVLFFHEIEDLDNDRFKKQMIFLREKTVPISIDRIDSIQDGALHTILTFDDGFRSVERNGLPVLIEYGIPLLMFIPYNYLGRFPGWEKEGSEIACNDSIMDQQELIDFSSNPLVTIGSHTMNHKNLVHINRENAIAEIEESKKNLEDLLNIEITCFSFPYGSFNEDLISICKEFSYKNIFSTIPDYYNTNKNNKIIGRIEVTPKDWTLEYKLKFLGAYSWLSKIREVREKIKL